MIHHARNGRRTARRTAGRLEPLEARALLTRVGGLAIGPSNEIALVGNGPGAGGPLGVSLFGANGNVDTGFGGGDGRVRVPIAGARPIGTSAVAVEPDGKILIAGTAGFGHGHDVNEDIVVARLTPAGVLDPSFGDGGVRRIGLDRGGSNADRAAALALGPGGAIVVAGTAATAAGDEFAVIRLTPNGALDPSFGAGGAAAFGFGDGGDVASGVAVAADGSVVVAGSAALGGDSDIFAVARLTPAGVLDPTFSGDGLWTRSFGTGNGDDDHGKGDDKHGEPPGQAVTDGASAVLLRPDGAIVVVGTAETAANPQFAVVQLTPTGTLDPDFGTGGITLVGPAGALQMRRAQAAALEPDGAVVVVGEADRNGPGKGDGPGLFGVVRLTSAGVLDPSFGGDGRVAFRIPGATRGGPHDREVGAEAVGIQSDGHIVVAGAGGLIGLARLDANGALDPGFRSPPNVLPGRTRADYDGDGISDYVVYTVDPATGVGHFHVDLSGGGAIDRDFGGGDDVAIIGDFDGDGITDLAVYGYSPLEGFSRFAVINSSDGQARSIPFGGQGDVPIVGDFDGDGIDDIAVYGYSPDNGFSRFAVLFSSGAPSITLAFGGGDDLPVAGDFDGDGVTDFAVFGYSPDNGYSRYAILPSGGGSAFAMPFGGADDVAVPDDVDGDGRTDFVVYGYSPLEGFSRFAVVESSDGAARSTPFGGGSDAPVVGDYDDDGRDDVAVYGYSPNQDQSRYAVLLSHDDRAVATPIGSPDSIAPSSPHSHGHGHGNDGNNGNGGGGNDQGGGNGHGGDNGNSGNHGNGNNGHGKGNGHGHNNTVGTSSVGSGQAALASASGSALGSTALRGQDRTDLIDRVLADLGGS